ncbi:two-component sensor histidine kinase BarA [Salmonella enterica subsp. enterica serovar Dublin]|uniref:two-component sensor histidine kinase BarA n=1 Tax=Salmonella enterica TaxID=28901 RepID=UPI000D3D40A8|nr:two-component sensor histidine kinase BarA [Salmonella enterica]PUR27190.1 two-component sensor histidine kinase BarA [Salmonella enterica subsp. enterica serovar Dublin]
MTNYSLRARMMILILAPTVLIGLLLSIFFVVHRYNDLQRQLEDAGASIIEPLAVSSEYGMNLQNRESIGQLISVLHRRHSDIVRAISVYDDHNRLFVTSNFHLDPSQMQLPAGAPFPRRLSVDRHGDIMILRTPIISESYSPDESAIADAKNTKNMLGYVALELDLKSVRLQQYKEIFISSVMMLFCIGIALIFGWRLMRDVTGPIRNMVNTVDRIRRGQLDSRVEGFMLGELDMLKNGINSMAMSLAAYHEEMQHNIDQATSDLRETLEQMEIQNVELDLAKKRAQEAARIKSEFLANMSHELRTPLNGVIGFTRLTLKTELNPTQRDHLNTIERSANNLLAIINDVLDFSKLEAGKLILESIPFPLRNTLDEVVTLLAHSSHDKGLELTLNIKNDVPDNVIGDPLRLQQVITNLVGNAIKFTESGNIDILVEKRALSNTKVQIEVQIRDTGIGIPERDQSRLFQAFRQADASISRRHGGTGLGLVITQKLVNEMGGDISFHSQPNRGSTFWFHIHLDLKMQFDLILMDIQMPDMDGIRACELIHQLPHQQQTPVIAVTAHAMAGQKEKLLSAGMNDYLAKPIEEEKLHNLLLRYKPGANVAARLMAPEPAEFIFNPNATLDWQLALRQAAGKPDLARDMLQMLIDFLPEVRNKIEEQLVGENPNGLVDLVHKLHGSCGYSGVPRMKNLCQLIEQQLRSGVHEEELEPEFLELLDEMDNVAREAKKILG